LSAHFTDVRPYLLADPESQRFGQIVVFATRKRVTGSTVRSSKQALINYCKGYIDMPRWQEMKPVCSAAFSARH